MQRPDRHPPATSATGARVHVSPTRGPVAGGSWGNAEARLAQTEGRVRGDDAQGRASRTRLRLLPLCLAEEVQREVRCLRLHPSHRPAFRRERCDLFADEDARRPGSDRPRETIAFFILDVLAVDAAAGRPPVLDPRDERDRRLQHRQRPGRDVAAPAATGAVLAQPQPGALGRHRAVLAERRRRRAGPPGRARPRPSPRRARSGGRRARAGEVGDLGPLLPALVAGDLEDGGSSPGTTGRAGAGSAGRARPRTRRDPRRGPARR